MRHRITFATDNEERMREIRALLGDLGLPVLSMKEAGVNLDIAEDGTTFGENAEIKAKAVWKVVGDTVLTDDSGLVVDYIGGEPGIYSARYMGEDIFCEIKNRNIINRLKDAGGKSRSARFMCSIAVMLSGGRVPHTGETMERVIAEEPAGSGGLEYDPILSLPEHGLTSAEVTIEEKNKVNHRGRALRVIKAVLEEMLKGKMERTQDGNISCQ